MSAGNARLCMQNARVHLFGRCVHFAVVATRQPFDEKMKRLVAQLREQQAEAQRLDAAIARNLQGLKYGG
jgi:hypothetical protein